MVVKVKKPKCWLKTKPFFMCCCACEHHIVDHYACTPERHKKKLCMKPRGWICNPPDFGATSEWPEHGCGCEMFQTKKKRVKKRGDLSTPILTLSQAMDRGCPYNFYHPDNRCHAPSCVFWKTVKIHKEGYCERDLISTKGK